MRNVCLKTYRNNRVSYKTAYFSCNIQILRVNNSGILKIKNAKFNMIIDRICVATYFNLFLAIQLNIVRAFLLMSCIVYAYHSYQDLRREAVVDAIEDYIENEIEVESEDEIEIDDGAQAKLRFKNDPFRVRRRRRM